MSVFASEIIWPHFLKKKRRSRDALSIPLHNKWFLNNMVYAAHVEVNYNYLFNHFLQDSQGSKVWASAMHTQRNICWWLFSPKSNTGNTLASSFVIHLKYNFLVHIFIKILSLSQQKFYQKDIIQIHSLVYFQDSPWGSCFALSVKTR